MTGEHHKMRRRGDYKTHPGRATIKLLFLAMVAVAGLLLCLDWVDQGVLNTIKHTLNVPTIILLVVIINLVSFVLFLLAYAAWQWVRSDLKPPRSEQNYSNDP